MSSQGNIFKTKDQVDRNSWRGCIQAARPLNCPFINQISLRWVNLETRRQWNIAPLMQSAQRCIIAHYGTFRKCWDCVILTAILYVATIVPYNAAFFKWDKLNIDCLRLYSNFYVQRFCRKLSSTENRSFSCIWWSHWGNFHSWYGKETLLEIM